MPMYDDGTRATLSRKRTLRMWCRSAFVAGAMRASAWTREQADAAFEEWWATTDRDDG